MAIKAIATLECVLTNPNENEKAPSTASTTKEQLGANPWNAIEVGSKVLAKSTEPGEDGFYLSVVEKISADGKTLTLKWAMYPKLPSFNTRRLAVGLLAKIGK